MTLAEAARDYVWLYDSRHGASIEAIARDAGVSAAHVRAGIERAKEVETNLDQAAGPESSSPRSAVGFELIPMFPVGPLTPQSACNHGPIPRGSRLVCMVCHASGMDDQPGLERDTNTDPSPEPPPRPRPTPADLRADRMRRRRRQFVEAFSGPRPEVDS